jgi:hypothetical protein
MNFFGKGMKRITVDIKPTKLELARVIGPFDGALAELQENEYEIISLPQNAKVRAHCGENHRISKCGSWVREWVLYVPNGKNKLITIPLTLKSAKKATQAHRALTEFYLTRDEVERYLTDSIDFPEKTIEIPTEELDLEELTARAFGGEKKAKNYGNFLYDAGIEKLVIYAVDKDDVNKEPLPFVRQMFFRSLNHESMLYSVGGLQYADRMFGIKNGNKLGGSLDKTQNKKRTLRI